MRILQVGYGKIGREVFQDWAPKFAQYMVVDLVQPIPNGHQWDGEHVDLVVILVDTPASPVPIIDGAFRSDGFDYEALIRAIEQYAKFADFILVRSTVSLGFLQRGTYLQYQDRIGFSPEFYGATKWSSREALSIDFTVFTHNVPVWFRSTVAPGSWVLGSPEEVIVAKLTENAFLATKVTFFHELALLCEAEGIDFETVRQIATLDPRIGPDHSYVEEFGWQSHCFDKDVPAFAGLGPEMTLVGHAIRANQWLLNARNTTPIERKATPRVV